MAKKSGGREFVILECPDCKERFYHTEKKTKGGAPKLELMKYCRKCRKRTKHLERRK